MKTLITVILLVSSIAIGFSQKKMVKRYGVALEIPKNWEADKNKDHTLISDKNWEAFVTLKEFSAENEDDMLKDVTQQVYQETKSYVSKERVDEKMIVNTDKNAQGLDYLRLYVLSDPDEENEVMVYEAWIFKKGEKAIMVSVLGFGEGVDPNNEYDMVVPKLWEETHAILESVRNK